MKSYNGTVLFVDMLGVSKLTLGEFSISIDEYLPWGDSSNYRGNTSLSFALYKEFQELIGSLSRKHKLNIFLLSDNAFVWSKNTVKVVKFCAEFMQKATKLGLLCRGGMCYGGIIEDMNEGKQILLGDAVTGAVKLEGKAKGSRILINQELPLQAHQCNAKFSLKFQNHLFKPFTNYLDYEVYDEFKWYSVHFAYLIKPIRSFIHEQHEQLNATIEQQMLINALVLSPRFSWNCLTAEGRVHVKATIQFIGETHPFKIAPIKFLDEHVRSRSKPLLDRWNLISSDPKNYA